ncbi:MAG: cupin domain-containing protein [Deltaproteobacteria bacterium]|nr:cupin domain-containing protein [Deltaproteobacteria bacterium]
MLVRNLSDKEVLDTTYIAHGGAIAQMILDARVLKEIGFFAIAQLEKGKMIDPHVDPMEEIYFIFMGEGGMTVDNETKHVKQGDAIWIPKGSRHCLINTGQGPCIILVIASPLAQ